MSQNDYAGKFTVENQTPCFHITVKEHREAVEIIRCLLSSQVMLQFENSSGKMLLGANLSKLLSKEAVTQTFADLAALM